MSFAFLVMMISLGSSLMTAFVLQPSSHPVSHHSCHAQSLQSIRKGLLRALNLQAEPWLPAGGLDAVRERWQRTFSTVSKQTEAPAVSVPDDGGNSGSLKCCSMTSEIFMKDLGWDNWVIHPSSLTIVQCAPCNPEVNPVQCALSHTTGQDGDSQEPCCQPNSQETVPVIYVDESSAVVISSVELTRSCGCRPGDVQQPSRE